MENKRNQLKQMGICEKCGAKQFLSYVTCNYNGICNGTIIPIEKSTRELALEWWNNLSNELTISKETKAKYANIYFENRLHQSLTGSEIEQIWLKKTTDVEEIAESMYKPNQKQFAQFSPELFKKYIDKFSDEDKFKALFYIAESLNFNVYQQQNKFELFPKLK